jgi:4-diphosphocytidyl-2-C-methyl-D-erythritol kinase
MTDVRTVTIQAPAKINLGLEILSRLDDGYHEIRSVLSMIDITDELRFSMTPGLDASRIDGVAGVAPSDNLIMRAIELFDGRAGTNKPVHVRVVKRIPAPSGLGSASSNAAATLVAMNHLHDSPLERADLMPLAASLGSDVPFFLGSPTAAVSGTGTTLAPLPNPSGWIVIVVPQIALLQKTATLYSMISPEDYSRGETVRDVKESLISGAPITPGSLANAFERPLRKLIPDIGEIVRVMREADCPHVALSGAGPAHYALFGDEAAAREARRRLEPLQGSHHYVVATRFRHTPLTIDAG